MKHSHLLMKSRTMIFDDILFEHKSVYNVHCTCIILGNKRLIKTLAPKCVLTKHDVWYQSLMCDIKVFNVWSIKIRKTEHVQYRDSSKCSVFVLSGHLSLSGGHNTGDNVNIQLAYSVKDKNKCNYKNVSIYKYSATKL